MLLQFILPHTQGFENWVGFKHSYTIRRWLVKSSGWNKRSTHSSDLPWSLVIIWSLFGILIIVECIIYIVECIIYIYMRIGLWLRRCWAVEGLIETVWRTVKCIRWFLKRVTLINQNGSTVIIRLYYYRILLRFNIFRTFTRNHYVYKHFLCL